MNEHSSRSHLLVSVLRQVDEIKKLMAYEPVERFMQSLINRLKEENLTHKVSLVKKITEFGSETFDFILCLEVLEHLPLSQREVFYGFCETHLKKDGYVLISVPVEFGLTLMIKEFGRVVLKGKTSKYSLAEFVKSFLGFIVYDPKRFNESGDSEFITNHKGFDYRFLRKELEGRFFVKSSFCTPFNWTPAFLGAQEIFFLLSKNHI